MSTEISFLDLGLSQPVLKALEKVGYENPSPIQAQTIPLLLEGKDVIGQAQTGTGKTAAFALPILSKIDLTQRKPQVLVLAPTRELAIQVAEAFQKYASGLKGFNVLPIYGGQEYSGQLRQLKRGVQVVVGTPGRVMDHMRRGSLDLSGLTSLVLDEADEMLRMGFLDDVEWILEKTPEERQILLFSATMPPEIRKIANRYLNDPEHISIKVKTSTAETINQRYWMVSGVHKLDALTRILEAETFEGILVFVRTKSATVELAEKLSARGYSCAALNGDIAQRSRERTVDQLKSGRLDIVVATDVAARGLDVDRISHVINYDIPYDTEAYVHRIGRTGRMGRSGEAILFVSPRERRMLRTIERATRKKIEPMQLPSTQMINDKRIVKFKEQISETIGAGELKFFEQIIEQFQQEKDIPAIEIAAALAKMAHGSTPFLLEKDRPRRKVEFDDDRRPGRRDREHSPFREGREGRDGGNRRRRNNDRMEEGMERFRIEVGYNHGVKPGNIVGAIANEAGLDSQYIGKIEIYDEHSTIDLPEGIPTSIFKELKEVWVSGQALNISKDDGSSKNFGSQRKSGKPKFKSNSSRRRR